MRPYSFEQAPTSDAELRRRLVADHPALAVAVEEEDHARVVALLRAFVYRACRWSDDGLEGRRYAGGRTSGLSAAAFTRLSAGHELGVLCGGSSDFLIKLCRLFGYEAHGYDYGLAGVATHVVALVSLPTGEGARLTVQDATFNAGLALDGVDDPDWLDLLERLLADPASPIVLRKGEIAHREICFRDDAGGREWLATYARWGVLRGPARSLRSRLTDSPILAVAGDLDFDTSYWPRYREAVRRALAGFSGGRLGGGHALTLMLFPRTWPHFRAAGLRARGRRVLERLAAAGFVSEALVAEQLGSGTPAAV